MKNTQHNIEIGKTYTVYGSKRVKVIGITETHIFVVWACNGQTPYRGCDRRYRIEEGDRFVEV